MCNSLMRGGWRQAPHWGSRQPPTHCHSMLRRESDTSCHQRRPRRQHRRSLKRMTRTQGNCHRRRHSARLQSSTHFHPMTSPTIGRCPRCCTCRQRRTKWAMCKTLTRGWRPRMLRMGWSEPSTKCHPRPSPRRRNWCCLLRHQQRRMRWSRYKKQSKGCWHR